MTKNPRRITIAKGKCCICGNKRIVGFINKKEYCRNCYERESWKIRYERLNQKNVVNSKRKKNEKNKDKDKVIKKMSEIKL